MRTTAFITFAIASLMLLSSTDAASLKERRGGVLHGVSGGAHNVESDLTLDLRSGKRALRERDVLIKERDVLVKKRGASLKERDVLVKERDISLTDNSGQVFSSAPVKRDNNGEKNDRNSKRGAQSLSDTKVVVA